MVRLLVLGRTWSDTKPLAGTTIPQNGTSVCELVHGPRIIWEAGAAHALNGSSAQFCAIIRSAELSLVESHSRTMIAPE
jgi:hypothetical protein